MFKITVETAPTGREDPSKATLKHKSEPLSRQGAKQETGMSVMFMLLHRVGPVFGLAVALFATVAWIGLVGYTLIKLF